MSGVSRRDLFKRVGRRGVEVGVGLVVAPELLRAIDVAEAAPPVMEPLRTAVPMASGCNFGNLSYTDDEVRRLWMDMSPLRATGGLCAPLHPFYDLIDDEPEPLPKVRAPRGGVRF